MFELFSFIKNIFIHCYNSFERHCVLLHIIPFIILLCISFIFNFEHKHYFEETETTRSLLGLLALLGLLLLLGSWDAALADDDVSEDLVQLLVLADGGEDVVGDESLLLFLLLAGVGLFEDLFDDLLEHGGHVDWGVGGDTLGISALLHVTVDTTDWEDDACALGTGLALFVLCHLMMRKKGVALSGTICDSRP